jgi:two-component system, NtrC family, response regulator HydG
MSSEPAFAHRPFPHNFNRFTRANPFGREHDELVQSFCGPSFQPGVPFWTQCGTEPKLAQLGRELQERMRSWARQQPAEVCREAPLGIGASLFEEILLSYLGISFAAQFEAAVWDWFNPQVGKEKAGRFAFFTAYRQEAEEFMGLVPDHGCKIRLEHFFAAHFQFFRALYLISRRLEGRSDAARSLRENVWTAIFSSSCPWHSMATTKQMRKQPILLLGHCKRTKDQIAEVVSGTQFYPFDLQKFSFASRQSGFVQARSELVFSNLAQIEGAQILPMIFGCAKPSAFGLSDSHKGALERCGTTGTIFLEAIHLLSPVGQSKILELVQTGRWSQMGDVRQQTLDGKLVLSGASDVVTDTESQFQNSSFIEALGGQKIIVPGLKERLMGRQNGIREWIHLFAGPWSNGDMEDEIIQSIQSKFQKELGEHYDWPGDLFELGERVNSYFASGQLAGPSRSEQRPKLSPEDQIVLTALQDGAMTANQWLSQYCTRIYAKTKNYEEAARILAMDRRTVKARIDVALLARLQSEAADQDDLDT